jgi:hypothetical protein
LDGLPLEAVGIFYEHLACFTAIWYMLWPFGIFHGYLVHFSHFGMLHQDKSGSPDLDLSNRLHQDCVCHVKKHFAFFRLSSFSNFFATLSLQSPPAFHSFIRLFPVETPIQGDQGPML